MEVSGSNGGYTREARAAILHESTERFAASRDQLHWRGRRPLDPSWRSQLHSVGKVHEWCLTMIARVVSTREWHLLNAFARRHQLLLLGHVDPKGLCSRVRDRQ